MKDFEGLLVCEYQSPDMEVQLSSTAKCREYFERLFVCKRPRSRRESTAVQYIDFE